MKQGQTTESKNMGGLLLYNLLHSIICSEQAMTEGTTARSVLQMNPEEVVMTQLVLQNKP